MSSINIAQPVSTHKGYKASGTSVLVAGTVTVTPGPAVAADDRVMIADSTPGAGAQGGLFVGAITAGGAGVGTFVITSTNAADTSTVRWILYDNTFGT
ncbi:MAG: hypothetical protein ACREDF_09475 [Thermoplasmata archaeon]